jgi:predicted metal-binding membrane protein
MAQPEAARAGAPGDRVQQAIVAACLLSMAALAWAWLLREAAATHAMAAMPGMETPAPGALVDYLPAAFLMWFVMMAAMMTPSATPMVLLYGRFVRTRQARTALASTALFAGAYLSVWAAFSLGAGVLQWTLVRGGLVSATDLALGGGRTAGALLAAAGLYQLTPIKRICAESCRSPLSLLMRLWRPGWAGALRLGVAHGMYCVGCCWLLMTLLFVGGVMNLAWVAVLALVVLVEKVGPVGRWAAPAVGVLALAAGAALMLGLSPPFGF